MLDADFLRLRVGSSVLGLSNVILILVPFFVTVLLKLAINLNEF